MEPQSGVPTSGHTEHVNPNFEYDTEDYKKFSRTNITTTALDLLRQAQEKLGPSKRNINAKPYSYVPSKDNISQIRFLMEHKDDFKINNKISMRFLALLKANVEVYEKETNWWDKILDWFHPPTIADVKSFIQEHEASSELNDTDKKYMELIKYSFEYPDVKYQVTNLPYVLKGKSYLYTGSFQNGIPEGDGQLTDTLGKTIKVQFNKGKMNIFKPEEHKTDRKMTDDTPLNEPT